MWDSECTEMLNSLNLPSLETRRKVLKLSLLYIIVYMYVIADTIINNLAVFPEVPVVYFVTLTLLIKCM